MTGPSEWYFNCWISFIASLQISTICWINKLKIDKFWQFDISFMINNSGSTVNSDFKRLWMGPKKPYWAYRYIWFSYTGIYIILTCNIESFLLQLKVQPKYYSCVAAACFYLSSKFHDEDEVTVFSKKQRPPEGIFFFNLSFKLFWYLIRKSSYEKEQHIKIFLNLF